MRSIHHPVSLTAKAKVLARRFSFLLLLLISGGSALAQGTLLQGGPWAPGRAPMYVGQGSGQAVVQDSGPAGGGSVGIGLSELGLTARGTGTPPYAGQGSGAFGTNFCNYDAPITNATGYHFLCMSPNTTQGGNTGGIITYGAGGTAAALPLNICVNGSCFTPGGTTPPTFVCNGSTDNSAAMNLELAKAVTAGEYTITLPAGQCLFTSAISKTLTGMTGLTITGAGKGTTYLKFTGANDGISLAPGLWGVTPSLTKINLQNMTLGTINSGSTDSNACIKIDNTANPSAFGDSGSLQVNNVNCDNSGLAQWLYGTRLISMKAATLVDFDFFGHITTSPLPVNEAISISNSVPLASTAFNVRGGFTVWAGWGIRATGSIQGLNVVGYNTSAVVRGVDWNTTTSEAQCTITASQFGQLSAATSQSNLSLTNCAQSAISGNLIYSYGLAGLDLIGAQSIAATANTIEILNTSGTGVRLSGTSTRNTVANNNIEGQVTGTSGINIVDAGSSGNVIGPNAINNVTTDVVDAGTSNTILRTSAGSLILGVNASQSGALGIANGNGGGATVSIVNAGASAPYSFQLPSTAGTSGQPMLSGGGSVAQTYGTLGLTYGGTNANLSATGGTSQFLKQATAGAAITVVRPVCADLSDAGSGCTGSAGITALTGDVTATGPGSVAATLATAQPAVHTWALAQTFTVGPVFNGLASGTGVATANTASTLVARDGSGNFAAGTITAALSGNATSATTATTATNATNTAITDDTATNAAMNLTWVTSNTANLPQKVTSTKLNFNPSTGALSATSFTGAGTGLTGTAASLTAGNVTTNANLTGAVTSTGNATLLGSFSSASLAGALTDETGTGVAVFGTSPTFTTSIIDPLLVGGSSTSQALEIRATSGNDVGSARINLTAGNNGASTLATFGIAGASSAPQMAMGTTLPLQTNMTVGFKGAGTGTTFIGQDPLATGIAGLWMGAGATPTGTNHTLLADGTNTFINSAGAGNVFLSVANTTIATLGSTGTLLNVLSSDAATTDATLCARTSDGLVLKGSGTLGICLGTSGRQFKTDFAPMKAGMAEIAQLNLWNYRYKKGFGDGGQRMQYGPTAQDVAEVLPDLVNYDANGEPINYDAGAFVLISLNALQQIDRRVTQLENRK